MHEAKTHEANCFVTLTFDDEHLPQDESLDLRIWQTFIKRLRKTGRKVRFYHCGEYGDLYGRPHYHACLFGTAFAADAKPYSRTKHGDQLYSSATLDKLWQHQGKALIGALTFESAAYVARYCMKKITGPMAQKHYLWLCESTGEIVDRKPEYATMSRRPGIGKAWYDKWKADVYPSDEVIINGRSTRPPKFYDGQYELDDPVGHAKLKAKRKKAAAKHSADQTLERLATKSICLEARLSHKQESL